MRRQRQIRAYGIAHPIAVALTTHHASMLSQKGYGNQLVSESPPSELGLAPLMPPALGRWFKSEWRFTNEVASPGSGEHPHLQEASG